MTLNQAFTMWACAPRNTVLAAKSRDAVQRVLMKDFGDVTLDHFSETFCRQIFYKSRECLEMKVKAASILVYVLQWGGDQGHCQRPAFTYDIASEEHFRAERDKGGRVCDTSNLESPCVVKPKVLTEPETMRADTCAKPEPCDEHGSTLPSENNETKTEENMTPKRARGKQARQICQIDADTLQVIRTYDSCSEGCRTAGVKGMDRAIKKLQKAGGYYWQYPEDVPTFAERLKQKQEAQPKPKKPAGQKPETDSKSLVDKFNGEQQMREQMKRESVITRPRFGIGDHVWAKQPEELHGRTGYVKAVDTKSMMYDVRFGNDMWKVLEKDLELVDESKLQPKHVYTPKPDDAPGNDDEAVRNAAHDALEVFSDDELLAELDKRGWQGELRIVQIVTIGKK